MIWRLCIALFLLACPAWAEVKITEVTSKNGIKAWLVEEHSLPFTALEISFQGGTSLDDPKRRGAVNLMTALLEEGAGELDSEGFAIKRDELAAKFSFDSDHDAVRISAQMLTENRDAAVDLLRLALTKPRFEAQALERVRGQVLSNIKTQAQSPDYVASNIFRKDAFGPHPYGSSGEGTAESVTKLTHTDMISAHQAALSRDHITVAAVGDITPAQLGDVLDNLFDDLPATGAALPGKADITLPAGIKIHPFDTPQAVIQFAQKGIARNDPDYFTAFVLNEMIGGDRFTTRLMTQLREKRGLTYGVRSTLAHYDHADLWVGRFATDNRTARQAIDVLNTEWKKAASGISEAELNAAKTYLTGSYPLRFDGNSTIAGILVGMQIQGLTPDYITTRNARINAVTLPDIERLSKKMIAPLYILVVGRPDDVNATLKE